MAKVIRSVKNVTKGYSSVQVKVRNATSNDPWGPTGTEMTDIAQMTFNSSGDFYEIMEMLDKRLNDKGKNWRHVLKALKVLDYILHEGTDVVVTWARKHIYIIKTLREFQYIDEEGRDVGRDVRVSAKELTSLILDEERLRSERADRKLWKSRVTGIEEFGTSSSHLPAKGSVPPSRHSERKARKVDEEDAEFQLAIEASKHDAEEDRRRRERNSNGPEDDDYAKAIKLSKEEEELRRKELEESNAVSLFDDTPQQPFTAVNQVYQQGTAVDWFANPVDQQTAHQQQPQSTGYLNNVYAQPSIFQNQPTGYPNGFGQNGQNSFQTKQTPFDQQVFIQPEVQQQNFPQPQASPFGNMNNPYTQQPGPILGLDQQQQQHQHQQQQQQQSQSNFLQAGTHNPWAQSQQSSQLETSKPAATGTNNPFASSFNRTTQPQPERAASSSLAILQEQKVQTQFNNHNFNPSTSFSPQTATPQKEMNPQHAHLNALLASGDGMDTFGNTGQLRIPAQHTAPGTFVNSSGQGLDRIHQSATGNNPFFSQQFTGVPQSTGFGNSGGFGQQQGGRLLPAQTGPASTNGFGGNAFGAPTSNPFGHQTQQSHQQQQGGSLIDI